MPKYFDGDNGKKDTSAIDEGQIDSCVFRLETYAFN